MQHELRVPVEDEGLRLLGYSGVEAEALLLAGDEVELLLFLHNRGRQPPPRHLYVSLLDTAGNGVAGWEGWPLPHYPTQTWAEGALAQVPVHFFLPPDLAAGQYHLTAGFLDPATVQKSIPANLTLVEVVRRPVAFTAPPTHIPVAPPVQFGTHARLSGYTVTRLDDTLQLTVIWEVLQTLLPPHHIFVHVYDAAGRRVAQSDGPPVNDAGRAPTGSWLPGEYLPTEHVILLPAATEGPLTLQLGLYLPATGERLPATAEGRAIGDSATISLPPNP
jgi:hypothetical protein